DCACGSSFIQQHAKPSTNHPLAVTGRGIAVRVQARVFRDVLPTAITSFLRGPLDPPAAHRLIRRTLARPGAGAAPALGDVAPPACGDPQCAVLLEYRRGEAGVVNAGVLVGGGDCYDKTIYVVHGLLLVRYGDFQSLGGSSRVGRASMLPRHATRR